MKSKLQSSKSSYNYFENEDNSQQNDEIQPQGQAIPLITVVNKKFIISKEAEDLLSNDKLKAVGIISLVGKYRTGKSFLLNRVLLNSITSKGFTVGPTIKPCTKGIWMWSKPMIVKNNYHTEEFHVFYIDTEGLGAYDEEINHDSKIFLIAIMISSLFLLNSYGTIDENSINNLSFILNLSQSIKLSKEEDKVNHEELAKYFPSLIWILRDFSLKLEDEEGNTMTSKQYLEKAISTIKGSSSLIDEKNKVRRLINLYFPERDCFTMIRPVESEDLLQNLNSLPDSELRDEFISQCKTLREKVSKKIKPKLFKNKVLSGKMILSLLTSIVDSLNQGAVPVIESSWTYVISNESNKYFTESIENYKSKLSSFTNTIKSVPSEKFSEFINDLKQFNINLKSSILDDFTLKIKSIDEMNSEAWLDKLQKKIEKEYLDMNEINQRVYKEKFNEVMNLEFKKIESKINENGYLASKYYDFFNDLEEVKESLSKSLPDIVNKTDVINAKQSVLIKKFIEDVVLKQISSKELENIRIINEISLLNNKNMLLAKEVKDLKSEIKIEKETSNDVLSKNKSQIKSIQDEFSKAKSEFKRLLEEKDNEIHLNTKEFSQKNELITKKISILESEIKTKDNQILVMKLNEDKTQALSKQKEEFNDKEVDSLKERNSQLTRIVNEQKGIIEEQVKRITDYETLTNLSKSSKIEENYKEKQIENLQNQLEETKMIYDEVINTLKSSITKEKEDKSRYLDYKEIVDSNKNLSSALSSYEVRCIKYEEKIEEYKYIRSIISSGACVQCGTCKKMYSLEVYKEHYEECMKGRIQLEDWKDKEKEGFKVKILKGIICQDKNNKHYIEYIIEVSYDINTSINLWRINKKFLNFANLHKALIRQFPKIVFPESSSIFSNEYDVSNNFYENKLKALESYIKDISVMEEVFTCQVYRSFIGIDEFSNGNCLNKQEKHEKNSVFIENDEEDVYENDDLFKKSQVNQLLYSSDDEKKTKNLKKLSVSKKKSQVEGGIVVNNNKKKSLLYSGVSSSNTSSVQCYSRDNKKK